ncbi:TonB-dependent receptor [Sulfurimonas sp.]|uniref:TonB-dependent receptor n=1 Tax=Sulfurimonas sp. TaxID=2022749 RepID=UPI002AB21120|nr:TonB-dependent receptor [Sulfurimonas sp.]
MNKIIPLSLVAIVSIYAGEVQLTPINIESTVITQVSQNAQVSADLAQALSTSVPSIDMNRRSGIANDVYIRGQKRDNISVEVDGTKVCGACPNRMDPPVSHVLANQIETIEVIEGPYDVETFGTMSGGIKIKTKAPTQKLHGEVNFGYGSFNYTKVGVTISGGNDIIRVLVSGSSESSDQYKDGNGDTLSQQTKKNASVNGNKYQTKYEDMRAYKKDSIMSKAFITTAQDQELRLSYTANRSSDVLYPNTPMDAIRDDSNIYSVEYNVDKVNDIYQNINLQYYYSDVDHPMSTEYRNAGLGGMTNTTNHMKTTMQGIKLKNTFDIANHKLLVGLDASNRTWKGHYINNNTGATKGTSIAETDTTNMAVFAKVEKAYGAFNVSFGARYDSTEIKSDDANGDTQNYSALNANIFTAYNLNKDNKLFIGFGQASRVPDARELYFRKGPNQVGTPELKQTTNREVDFGYETDNDTFKLKIKGFYSMLSDYIYYQKQANNVAVTKNNFNNIDATVYGAELSASVYATDSVTVDAGVSYKRGEKDKALAGQTDKDLSDMAPLRGNIALNYEYKNNSIATVEVQASDTWSNYDSDNGEQELGSWAILNLKIKHAINKNFDFTLGVNNLFDETYAQSNTYADLTLVAGGATDIMLLNEPGRYIYTNLTFKF